MADKEYDNELKGALFKTREKKSDRSPDYNGNVQVEGVEYWVSGWVKQGRNGPFVSLALTKKDANAAPRQTARQPSGGDGFLDEGIGGGASSERSESTSRLTPEQVAEMGRARGASGKKHDPSGGWDDDIPFNY